MKYFAKVAYSGERYAGFQRQPNHPTVQGELEKQISFLLGAETAIKAAGRTDAGVHAKGQTFTFEGEIKDRDAFLIALNKLLPEDIYVLSLTETDDRFDARFDATGKVYQYTFTVNERDPLRTGKIAQLRRDDFDFDRFLQGLECFKGKHCFQNFTTKTEDQHGFVRTVSSIRTERQENGNLIVVTFKGNGFMRYQIRMMVGAAIRVGLGKLTTNDIENALNDPNRNIIPYKAPAEGLCLLEVLYER